MAHKKPESLTLPTRIAWGEFEHPEHYPKTSIHARFKFLEIIERECPHVLRNLVRTVRPHYERARAKAAKSPSGELGLLSMEMPEISREYPELAHDLRKWATRYNLDAAWIYPIALNSLFHWTGPRIPRPSWQWRQTKHAQLVLPSKNRFLFSRDGWDVTRETRAVYKARMEEEFLETLNGHLENLAKLAAEQGWKRTRELRIKTGKGGNPYQHFYYLAYWQVNSWTISKILQNEPKWPEELLESLSGKKRAKRRPLLRGAASNPEAQRVRKGILDAAEMIGLEPRPGEPGRPKARRKPQPKAPPA